MSKLPTSAPKLLKIIYSLKLSAKTRRTFSSVSSVTLTAPSLHIDPPTNS